MSKESTSKTLMVAFVLCVVCAVVVSTAAVSLRPAQQANKVLDLKANILASAGLLEEGLGIEEQFEKITTKVVDLSTGKYTDAVNAETYDQRKAAKDPALSDALSGEEDLAKIIRREKYAKVYLLEGESGIDKVILPIKGYGLWSTLYGFIALESDLNTIAGIGFYEHGETPGLGGEVDNPLWKAKWIGKKAYADNAVAVTVMKAQAAPGSAHQIDGLAGATLTSRGIDNFVKYWLGESGFTSYLNNLKAGEA